MAAEKKTNRGGIMALVSRFSSKMSVFTLGVKFITMKLNNYEMHSKSSQAHCNGGIAIGFLQK
jgi:hypothetical protein